MATYKTILQISELGLSGDKQALLKYLHDLAIKEINEGKHSSYNGLIKLVNKYQHLDSLQEEEGIQSSSFNTTAPKTNLPHEILHNYLPKKIWISKTIQRKLSNFIDIYKHRDDVSMSRFNNLNKILLFGPPGSGKTTLGFYLAKELNKTIRYVRISDIISHRFGETIKNLSDLFERSQEDIIFIDEFDAFGKKRDDSNDIGELKRIVNAMIQILDFQTTNKIIVVSTNLVGAIDPAVLRRFTFKIEMGELEIDEAIDFFSFLIKTEDRATILEKEDIMIILDILPIITLDSIRIIFEKTLINSLLRGLSNFDLNDYLETLITEGYLDKKYIKELQNKSPKGFHDFKNLLMQKYSQKEICQLLGIHRNSYKNYFS